MDFEKLVKLLYEWYPKAWDRLLKFENFPVSTPFAEVKRKVKNGETWRFAWKWFGIAGAFYAFLVAETRFPWDILTYGFVIALVSSYLVAFRSVRGRISAPRQSICGAVWIMSGIAIPLLCWQFVNWLPVPNPARDWRINFNFLWFLGLAILNVVLVLSLQSIDQGRE